MFKMTSIVTKGCDRHTPSVFSVIVTLPRPRRTISACVAIAMEVSGYEPLQHI